MSPRTPAAIPGRHPGRAGSLAGWHRDTVATPTATAAGRGQLGPTMGRQQLRRATPPAWRLPPSRLVPEARRQLPPEREARWPHYWRRHRWLQALGHAAIGELTDTAAAPYVAWNVLASRRWWSRVGVGGGYRRRQDRSSQGEQSDAGDHVVTLPTGSDKPPSSRRVISAISACAATTARANSSLVPIRRGSPSSPSIL
jgi:hypothetical protein